MSMKTGPATFDTKAENGNKAARSNDTFRTGPPNVDIEALMKLPNAYNWPLVVRNCGQKFKDIPVFMAPVTDDPLTRVNKIREMPMREDDILLTAFPKCGTHWTNEIISRLLGSSSRDDGIGDRAAASLVEFVNDLDSLQNRPSPRLLNSHLYIDHLPVEIVQKKVKIVHVMRNAKDTAVSFYYHLKSYSPVEPFSFEEFIQGYMTQDYSMFGDQFDFLRQLSEFEKANPNHPILHIRYEDLKQDPVPVVQEIAQFLGISVSESFCRDVVNASSFDNMKKANESMDTTKLKVNINMYRKGLVGDWKNHFTVAQSEQFDEFAQGDKKKGSGYILKGL